MTGRNFTLCRQFYTARKLTTSHGIMPKVEIYFKILRDLCYDKNWFKKSSNTSVTIFVCLFVCLIFLLSNQRNNKIFLKQSSWMVSFPFIYSFLFRQIKRYGIIILCLFCWDNHRTDLVDTFSDNSAIPFYSLGAWPGFFKGREGEEEGCHTVSNREYSPDCHVDLSWIGYSDILRHPDGPPPSSLYFVWVSEFNCNC